MRCAYMPSMHLQLVNYSSCYRNDKVYIDLSYLHVYLKHNATIQLPFCMPLDQIVCLLLIVLDVLIVSDCTSFITQNSSKLQVYSGHH